MGDSKRVMPQGTGWEIARQSVWPVLLVLAAAMTGFATMNRDALFSVFTTSSMAVGLLLGILALVIRPQKMSPAALAAVVIPIIAVVIILYAAARFWYVAPGAYVRAVSAKSIRPYWMLTAGSAVLAGMCVLASGWLSRVLFGLILAAFLGTGVWLVILSPKPVIDVWVVHQAACEALSQGDNPYDITYPDVYGPNSGYMDEVEIKDGMVQAGYPYPPLTLIMALPSWYATGDSRYSDILAMAATAVILVLIDRGRTGVLLGTTLLLMPMALYIIEQNWTESHVLLLLAATAWCCVYRPELAPWAFGLFIASKQHLFVTLAVAPLLMPHPRSVRNIAIFITKALVAAAVVTLPFFWWNPDAFAHSALRMFGGSVGSHVVLRKDSTTFWAVMQYLEMGNLPPIASPVAAAVLALLATVRYWKSQLPGTGGLLAIAVMVMSLFAFSPHGFTNHYYFVFGAMLCALATYSAYCSRPQLQPAPAQGKS